MNSPAIHTIPIVTGIGTGSTALSAFDGALRDAGIANYNLIRLSSVVPAHTAVDATGTAPLPVGGWGDRLYCVYAEQRATAPGDQAWAGIGWVQRLDGAGGLFVEHEGDSEQFVADAIEASLADLAARRPETFGPAQKVLTGTKCVDAPVCALVVAAYETAGWGFTR
ncbi:MAG TPA: pyruvoyl-dependent arginine decarboxylase [Blastococcus sp.]|jgi:arginine decarboxylase|nr:pyruvoyl-dependent arginine decarboxylase [Blastococcus sp.]